MNWDSCCDFYLRLPPEQLFETIGVPGLERYRCKGCQQVVQPSKRREHHARHVARADLGRRRQQLQSLAKARRAKQPKLVAETTAQRTADHADRRPPPPPPPPPPLLLRRA